MPDGKLGSRAKTADQRKKQDEKNFHDGQGVADVQKTFNMATKPTDSSLQKNKKAKKNMNNMK